MKLRGTRAAFAVLLISAAGFIFLAPNLLSVVALVVAIIAPPWIMSR